ncbi:MAG: histidine phosphatase family protein [Chlamydiota bacterium]|jgi:broad specificity phosphatase PhoE
MKIYNVLSTKYFLFIAIGICTHVTGKINIPKEPFLFVRHGRTDWSKTDISLGPLDLPLNEWGIQDAEKAASLLKTMEKKEVVIISSELMRTQQTAAIIAEKIQLPVHALPNLHERYFGDFRLLKESSLENIFPPDAETQEAFQKRIDKAISNALNADAFTGKCKIIVAHSHIFKYLSLLLTGEKASINYGDVFLFTPSYSDETWRLQKIEKPLQGAKRNLKKCAGKTSTQMKLQRKLH